MARALAEEWLAEAYIGAKEHVLNSGFHGEIDWQEDVEFSKITESDFLKETCWVILNSGFRERTARKVFPGISNAFGDWVGADYISRKRTHCKRLALQHFNHARKIDAMIEVAGMVSNQGFEKIKDSVQREGIDYLKRFPFIGPVTALHLAKNLGIPVAKPDRHLVRTAQAAGFSCVQQMCSKIASDLDEKIAVVDLVIWRFATLNSNYEDWFRVDPATQGNLSLHSDRVTN